MGSKANKVSSMNIAWNFVKCPQDRRAKLYVTGKVRESVKITSHVGNGDFSVYSNTGKTRIAR